MEESELLKSQGFEVINEICEGSFGKYFVVRHPEFGIVSAKVISNKNFDTNLWDKTGIFEKDPPQVRPFIIEYIAARQFDKMTVILMEHCNMKNLFDLINTEKDISIPVIRTIMKEIRLNIFIIILIYYERHNIIVEGLRYIHSKGIIHRTPVYLPPEFHEGDENLLIKADAKVDVWEAGMILYRLVILTYPFKSTTELANNEFMKLKQLVRPESIQNNPLWDLLTKMLSFDRKERISAEDALYHPFFTGEQAWNEISSEAVELAKEALDSKENGDMNISPYDADVTYSLPIVDIYNIFISSSLPESSSPETQQLQPEPSHLTVFPSNSNNQYLENEYEALIAPIEISEGIIPSNIPYESYSLTSANSSFFTSWKESDFEEKERLGKGGFGIVRHVIEKSTERHMAWKEMDYKTENEKEMVVEEKNEMISSYQILKESTKSSSPFESSFLPVVEPLGFFLSDNGRKAYLVMELCEGGDLRKFINTMKKPGMEISPERAWDITAELAFSLTHLHFNNEIHSDLKPENILLTKDFKVKIADFGLSRQLQVEQKYTFARGGTKHYKAPELISELRPILKPSLDIWTLGVMIFELIAQRHPFFDNKTEGYIPDEEFIRRLTTEEPANLPAHYPKSLKNLIKMMLAKDAARRITAEEILEIPEIATILASN